MLHYTRPCFMCFLSDENGNIISPYNQGALQYINLSVGDNYAKSQCINGCGRLQTNVVSAVLIKGYVTVYNRGAQSITTVPFSAINTIRSASSVDDFAFVTTCFGCSAVPILRHKGSRLYSAYIKVPICIHTAAYQACGNTEQGAEYASSFSTCITVYSRPSPLKAKVQQYTALSDGVNHIYTSDDALPEYGGQGLLSPDEASVHNLFVNGMVQPYSNYRLRKDTLELLTEDVPGQGEPIIVSYVKLLDECNRKLNACHRYYVTAADGVSTTYTDSDRLPQYESSGIPDPHGVSYYNLYVNAVLQPAATYTVRKGVLELTAPPAKGEYIVFESVTVLEG